jgi:hypothetical protein
MKKTVLPIIAIAVFAIMYFSGCKDDDSPSLAAFYLNGNTEMYLALNSSFVDPGFVALNDDGNDVSNEVQVINHVDTTIEGDYYVLYKKVDIEDTLRRLVKVRNEAGFLKGRYLGTFVLPFPGTTPVKYFDSILIDNKINNRIYLRNFAGYDGVMIPAMLHLKSLEGDILEIEPYTSNINGVDYSFTFEKSYFTSSGALFVGYTQKIAGQSQIGQLTLRLY